MNKKNLMSRVYSRKNAFLKLNILSAICGFFFAITIQSALNIYRIERLSKLGFNTLEVIYTIFYIVKLILLTWILIVLIRKWILGKLSRFWLTILWFPYFLVFNYIWISLFPLTYRGDIPSPGTGLIIMFGIILYPFYLAIVSLFASKG
ncbi:hypothetical protein F8154_01110 [Alkaliphilus pronyensis]|uniref:Uncharacterized protein n=1 Tax=Alkaliphilus pronyensis TaxID=1482732 RepID=A0A6I0F8L1_9FIRM|nr:hypothetical protein [Alkaliphilus pronyensis]KAB3539060.1 hypothetical protein F8154_01110 [Alkaliphilus pronyensis]